METRDHLFELIKSLSKSEKGYFKKINSFHIKGTQNNYMLLFDTLDKMEEYDDRILKKLLHGRITAQLAFLKHYLYHQLLDALDQYYQSSNVEINKFICKVEILYKKGLTEQGRKLLDKALEFAWKKEKFSYLLQLTSLRYEFLADEENRDRLHLQKDQLNHDLTELRNKIDNLYEYHQLRIELNLLRAETGYARNKNQVVKYEELLQRPALATENAPLSGSAKYHFYSLRGIILNYTHQYVAAYESLQKAEALFTQYPVLFEESVSARIKTLQRKSAIAGTLGRFDTAMKDIQQMREVKATQEKYRALIFQNGFHQEFLIYLLTGKFSELLKRVPAFKEEYKLHSKRILKTFELQLLQRIGQACFIEAKFEDALNWINQAINTTPPAFRDDVVSGIKMDEILTHFELGNLRLVRSKIAAAEKYLRSKNKPFTFEIFLLSFLEKLLESPDPESSKEQWKKAHTYLRTTFNDSEESVPVKYFYIDAWMESKIKGLPLAPLLKKQVQQFQYREQVQFAKQDAGDQKEAG
ncbi:MAG TPA: hypothetical protein PLD84_09755 [Chitinophagales bacterium]|nr:hypothetical protein [Chitinophagales bacterium]